MNSHDLPRTHPAPEPTRWLAKGFYAWIARYLSLYIGDEDQVLDVRPAVSMACHFNHYAILESPEEAPTAVPGGPAGPEKSFGRYWLLNGTVHYEKDVQGFVTELASRVQPEDRLILVFYNALWRPVLRLASALRLRAKRPEENWISPSDVNNFLLLSGFEPVRRDSRLLCPVPIPIASWLLNRLLAPLPFLRGLTLLNILVARRRPTGHPVVARPSVSIVVPARNESGNIPRILGRIPKMGPNDELVFIEGHSTDDTWAVIQRETAAYRGPLRVLAGRQDGQGKGDAVRKGFALATNEILMILDADLTVPPEELPKFYDALRLGFGEFINGSRLVYPMEEWSMRFLNLLGNKFFAVAFSYVLGQEIKDTLCGTKAIRRADYLRLAARRNYFGALDPFGDFDLLFGSARLGLKIVEIPIRYRDRICGSPQIRRWRHGALLLAMLLLAARKFLFR